MSSLNTISIFSMFVATLYFPLGTNAARFIITNSCLYTVWAAAVPVSGGMRLDSDQTWIINVPNGTTSARIWPRTNCQFDASGRGRCQTGDCNGLLACQGYGQAPNTIAEFTLKAFNNLDFVDISVVDGFNVPIELNSDSESCSSVIKCTADINGQCPIELRDPGGCNNPCTVFKNDQYCCTGGGSCDPTIYSIFFKNNCPDAYSYPLDDRNSSFTCPSGTNYIVTFCP